MSAIIPPKTTHINGIFGMCFKNPLDLVLVNGLMNSLPYDYFVRALGKSNFRNDTANMLPVPEGKYTKMIVVRTLLLNCITTNYNELWEKVFDESFKEDSWLREDPLLRKGLFQNLTNSLCCENRLSDYERRELLIELDVLVAMSLGFTLEHLITLYTVQFPVHKNYEENTWYDAEGKIVFTINKGQTRIGLERKEWNIVKENKIGYYTKEIVDDTVDRNERREIKYLAPYVLTYREENYKEIWKYVEKI